MGGIWRNPLMDCQDCFEITVVPHHLFALFRVVALRPYHVVKFCYTNGSMAIDITSVYEYHGRLVDEKLSRFRP